MEYSTLFFDFIVLNNPLLDSLDNHCMSQSSAPQGRATRSEGADMPPRSPACHWPEGLQFPQPYSFSRSPARFAFG